MTLSAIAFETLLGSPGNEQQVAADFAKCWEPFRTIRLRDVRGKVDPDPDPVRQAEQLEWPVHRKWAKELYEARNSHVHRRGNNAKFKSSSNWTSEQHIVLAAFAYPPLVKLIKRGDGLYTLDPTEEGYCRAFDELLSDGFELTDPHMPPRWSSILTEQEQGAALQRAIETAFNNANRGDGEP